MVDAVENRIEKHTLQTPACHDIPLQHGELGIDADKS